MGEKPRRYPGERVGMAQNAAAIKEIEELHSEISLGGAAKGEFSSATEAHSGDESIGISLIDLAEILDQHKQWVESGGETGVKADLCGINLAKADLTGVNLQGAHLHRTNLAGADLSMANLRGASLVRTNLQSANLLGRSEERRVGKECRCGWARE